MEISDVLIIGAGAAGLMAAYKLSRKGKKVIVLEARNRTGGRIYTITNHDFFKHAELGAEFIHGDLPVTLELLKEAGITYEPSGTHMARFANGAFVESDSFIEKWDLLMEKLDELETDISIGQFLDEEFGDEKYSGLRASVTRYVAGYDTADAYRASAFALREEWENEDDSAQHRVTNGYCAMIKYLADQCKQAGNPVYLNSVVKKINWQKEHVNVFTADGAQYVAKQVVIALPLGILQSGRQAEGSVTFNPPLPEYLNAAKQIGFGAIIKFLLEFDEPFWLNDGVKKNTGKNLQGVTFIISDEEVPTWWMQKAESSAVLTGWLGGPPAEKKKYDTSDELLQQALRSLSVIFKISAEDLKNKLIAWNIVNWTAEPFTLGSYAYDTVESHEARKILKHPVDDTLFFAGEYLYEGPSMGTVEAALTSGAEVAQRIS